MPARESRASSRKKHPVDRRDLSRTNQVLTISAIAGATHVLLIAGLLTIRDLTAWQAQHARPVQFVGTVALIVVAIGYGIATLRSFTAPCHWLGRAAPAAAIGLLILSAVSAYSGTYQRPYLMAGLMSYGFLLPGPLVLGCAFAWLLLRGSAQARS